MNTAMRGESRHDVGRSEQRGGGVDLGAARMTGIQESLQRRSVHSRYAQPSYCEVKSYLVNGGLRL